MPEYDPADEYNLSKLNSVDWTIQLAMLHAARLSQRFISFSELEFEAGRLLDHHHHLLAYPDQIEKMIQVMAAKGYLLDASQYNPDETLREPIPQGETHSAPKTKMPVRSYFFY